MAGYSGTPLPKKLIIKDGNTVALLGAPEGFEAKLVPLPPAVKLLHRLHGPAEVILLFADSRQALEDRFRTACNHLEPKGRLWVAWPKKASGIVTDINENFIREYGLEQAFVDYKVCAIDETWSGLCFARRS
jgi:hypothetical protein